MNEWEVIKSIYEKKFYTAILQFMITMIATVVFDLTIAIVIGVAFSAIIFIVHVSDMQISIADVDKSKLGCDNNANHDKTGVVYITGPLYFGTASKLSDNLSFSSQKDIIIFSMRGVPFTDLSGADSLHTLIKQLRKDGVEVYFVGIQPKVMEMFRRCGISKDIGEDCFFWSADLALSEIAKKAA